MAEIRKQKLYYLSTTYFAQVDVGILHHLTDKFEVIYGVIMSYKNSNLFDIEIRNYCERHNIFFEAFYFTNRQRNIMIGFELLKVLKAIKKKRPDIIYTFSFDNPIFSLVGLLLDKNKTIAFIHDVEFHSNFPNARSYKIGRVLTMKHFKTFQVFSKNQETLFRKLYPGKQIYNIPLNLSDFGYSDKYVEPRKLTKSITRFLFFGNILPYKGLDILLKAVNSLSNQYSDFELVIAGDCNNWDEQYEPLIKDSKKVKKIIRHIKNEELANLFAQTHYLVLPYRDATQSGPLMIAYNYNVPVIASDIPAFKETMKQGECGYFFESENILDLEKFMALAINQSTMDYEILRTKQKDYVQANFSTTDIVAKYELMFADFLSNKGN